jgi:hypothetical protein
MAKNIVSQPPLMTAMVDNKGMPSRAWGIFFRDLYRRTAFQGDNAIDGNKSETDQELVNVNSTLQEIIVAVNQNNSDLTDHENSEEAHGSNGNIVGFNDLATNALNGLVKQMTLIANAIVSTATVTNADASSAPTTYTQAHSQELVALSNANKAAINTLVVDLNNSIAILNQLIAASKIAGQMAT